MYASPVGRRLALQDMQYFFPFFRIVHINKVDENDSSYIPQAQLSGNFRGGFLIDMKQRIFLPAAVDINDGKRLRMVENQTAA